MCDARGVPLPRRLVTAAEPVSTFRGDGARDGRGGRDEEDVRWRVRRARSSRRGARARLARNDAWIASRNAWVKSLPPKRKLDVAAMNTDAEKLALVVWSAEGDATKVRAKALGFRG